MSPRTRRRRATNGTVPRPPRLARPPQAADAGLQALGGAITQAPPRFSALSGFPTSSIALFLRHRTRDATLSMSAPELFFAAAGASPRLRRRGRRAAAHLRRSRRHERGWVAEPGSLSGFTKRGLNGARTRRRDPRAAGP